MMESSIVKDVTVRNAPIASVANCELWANTCAFHSSNFNSYPIRTNAAMKMTGSAEKKVTSVSFQPNEKAMAMQPIMLKTEIRGNTPFKPISS